MNLVAAVIAVSFLQFFEARNQVANFIIDPPSEGDVVKAELPELVVTEACPGCEGKGVLLLEQPEFGQSDGRMGKPRKERVKCPLCGGRKKIEAFINPSDLMLQVAADRAAFEAEHQGRGEIAVGEAFVPREKYESLPKEKRKLVDNAYGRPCKKCNWTGVVACSKCKGRGVIECSNRDCKAGWIVTKTKTSSSVTRSGGASAGRLRSGSCGEKISRDKWSASATAPSRTTRTDTRISVSPCPECGGINLVICPECNGRRAKPCGKCNGVGVKKRGSM